jgi:hypothetical protein
MLTLREQLQHKPFRQWMAKTPNLTAPGRKPPWRLFVQRQDGSNWALARFMTYEAAYAYMKDHLTEHYDMALNCSRQSFKPPVVRIAGVRLAYSPAPAGYDHEWCGYCRRMTQFRFFINGRHPAMKNVQVDPTLKRCVICGVRHIFLHPYKLKF